MAANQPSSLSSDCLEKYSEIQRYEKELRNALETGNKEVEAEAYRNLGKAYDSLEDFEEAIKCYKKNLDITSELGDQENERKAHCRLGNAYNSLENYQEAIKHWEECLNIASELGDRQAQGTDYWNLGCAHLSLKNYDDAVDYLKKNLDIAILLGDKENQGQIHWKLGNAYGSVERFQEAIKHHSEHLKIAIELGDKDGEGKAYGNLSHEYSSLGNYEKAIEYQEKQLRVAVEMADRAAEGSICGNLGDSCKSLEKYHEAIDYYNKSLAIALELGDKDKERGVYSNLGIAHRNLGVEFFLGGNQLEAITHHKKDLDIAIQIGDRYAEGCAYANLGNAYCSIGEYDDARQWYNNLMEIALETGDKNAEGKACGGLGLVNYFKGNFQRAVEFHEKSLKIALEQSDRDREGIVYGNLGLALKAMGKFQKAIEYHKKSLNIAFQLEDKLGEGKEYCNIGNALRSLGMYNEAIKYHQKHLKVAQEIGDRHEEGNAYGNMGSVHQLLGDYQKAFKYHERHLNIALELGEKQGESDAYGNLGGDCTLLERFADAIEYCNKQLSIASLMGDTEGEGMAYSTLADAYLSQGKFKEAVEFYQKSMDTALESENRNRLGDVYYSLGNAYFSSRHHHEAKEYYEKALAISRETDDKSLEGQALYGIGEYYYHASHDSSEGSEEQLSRIRESETNLQESIRCFNWLFDNLEEQDDYKVSIFDTFIQAYKCLTALLSYANKTKDALIASEHGRARALADRLRAKYSLISESATTTKALQYSEIQNSLLSPEFSVLFLAQFDAIAEKNLRAVVAAWVLTFQEDVSFHQTDMKGLQISSKESSVDIDDTQSCKSLVVNTVLDKVYNKMNLRQANQDCEDRSFNEDEHLDDQLFSGDVREFEKTSKDMTESRCIYDEDFDEESSVVEYLEVLFDVLLSPLQHVMTKEDLVIVPDGPLNKIPFAALRDPKTKLFLCETKRIRIVPSLTTLKLLKESPVDYHTSKGAVIIGNPEVGEVIYNGERKYFGSLPGAQSEAELISKTLKVQALTGASATKEEVIRRLREGVAVIHFAAHGSPDGGAIALSPGVVPGESVKTPEERDYLLTIKDVQEIGIRAQLVVLSCCHSGRGEIKAEGVVGICRAFLAAGARAVVGALWAIEDEATKVFMELFYKQLKEECCASRSLQQAMIKMMKGHFEEPKFWAPFFLMGEDVKIEL